MRVQNCVFHIFLCFTLQLDGVDAFLQCLRQTVDAHSFEEHLCLWHAHYQHICVAENVTLPRIPQRMCFINDFNFLWRKLNGRLDCVFSIDENKDMNGNVPPIYCMEFTWCDSVTSDKPFWMHLPLGHPSLGETRRISCHTRCSFSFCAKGIWTIGQCVETEVAE